MYVYVYIYIYIYIYVYRLNCELLDGARWIAATDCQAGVGIE